VLALLLFIGLSSSFGITEAQIVVYCNNITDCVTCAKAPLARNGATTCTWCITTGSCFDRYFAPDSCSPSSSVTLSDAGSRCSTIFGLPVGYGVLIIILIVLVPVLLIASIILIRRRLRDKQLKNMLKYAERAESVKQRPISIASGSPNNDDINYTNTGSTTSTTSSAATSSSAINVKGVRGMRGSRSNLGTPVSTRKNPTKDPLIEGSAKDKSDPSSGNNNSTTSYVPPSLHIGGRRPRRSRRSLSVETSESSTSENDSAS